MEDSVKGLLQAQVDNVHFSLICQVSLFITKGGQVGQGEFPLGEAMLTPPNDFLVPGNGSEEQLLYHLPKDGEEADQLLGPWVLLHVPPEDRTDMCFSPVLSQMP